MYLHPGIKPGPGPDGHPSTDLAHLNFVFPFTCPTWNLNDDLGALKAEAQNPISLSKSFRGKLGT